MAESQPKARARALRRTGNEAEARLWRVLRARALGGLKFRRQHPVGPFILDFYCHELGLAVEVDGGQHYEANHAAVDERRTAWLAGRGIRVVRFSSRAVLLETDAVCRAILIAAGGDVTNEV